MSKEIYISSTPHETRLAIVEKDELTEIYYERENEYTLAGSIYNGRVTRVLPGMQSSFVDIGLERDAFLYITDFMEEAGDAADFDGGEARGARSERPARSEARTEGGAAEARPEGRSEARSEGGAGRGRDRGRGRRDGRQGQRREQEPRATENGDASWEQPGAATNSEASSYRADFVPPEDEVLALIVHEGEGEGEAVGEGAPGADGSRRWRGRRGRRRGRGAGGEAAVSSPQGESAEADAVQESAAPEAPEQQTRSEGMEPTGRQRREGRQRGGFERSGREPRAERGSGDVRQDAPRERFAPRSASAGADEEHAAEVDLSASAEPFILPGESLSKYRKNDGTENGNETKRQPEASVTLKPSTEVAPLVGWDGGATLPGETLARHRESRSEGRSDFRSSTPQRAAGADDRGGQRRAARDEQRGRSERGGRDQREGARQSQRGGGESDSRSFHAAPRGLEPAEAVQPAVTAQQDTAEREYMPTYEAQTDRLEAGAAAGDQHAEAMAEELHTAVQTFREDAPEFDETTTEYEPGNDASASFRVDPASPREYRQAAPVEDEVEVGGSSENAPLPATLEADHDFTSVQAGGEMISEESTGAGSRAHVLESFDAPGLPMHHEGAVETQAPQAEAIPFPAQEEQQQDAGSPQGFAPGDGQLEEELLDDDDAELGTLHAHGLDEEHEEEPFEHASSDAPDIGSMLRDMSIDDITRPEPAEPEEEFLDDEEDFEEDELASSGQAEFDEEEASNDADDTERSAEPLSREDGESAEHGASDGEGTARMARSEAGRRGRRDGRRGGRDRGARSGERSQGAERNDAAPAADDAVVAERGEGRERSGSERSSGFGGTRDRRGMAGSRHGGGRERGGRSMQSTNLPAISDLLKPGQELLVQIAKEPIAKKGARITSHIALPGRFLVFMPTVGHTGVSRKIESDAERRRLKEILLSERGEATGGFIVRTAAAGASEEELRSDLRFLLNLWADIKARSESSKSPALIYHDLNLIERILRDQVTDNFSAIWVDTESEYERVLRFLQRFQPSLIRRVKLYTKDTPLFEQFGITEEINKALRAKVWLKSGGSIVINQTEALVAIDINTGKYVGKTARLEDTILKTNLDAIPEIVRQIRLRDLGGIIIIDFIDMDERKNRNKVMAALEEELKNDRAPSKVLQFNDFGLVAITRKRVKQSLERTLSTTCGVCAGTGMVKSPVTVCNDIYIEMRKMHKLIEKGDIMLRVNPEVVKQLKSGSGKWLQEMEEMSGKTILVKSDPSLHPEQFDIH